MSIDISLEKQIDPFYKPESCSKCGGKLALRVSSTAGGTETRQVCRGCGHEILTAKVNVIRVR